MSANAACGTICFPSRICATSSRRRRGYYVAMNRVNGDFAFQETKRVVDEVTVIYLWALNDLYGMKAKRLARAYDGAEVVSKAMAHDSMQVCAKVKEIEDAGLRMRFCGKNAMDMAKEIARL